MDGYRTAWALWAIAFCALPVGGLVSHGLPLHTLFVLAAFAAFVLGGALWLGTGTARTWAWKTLQATPLIPLAWALALKPGAALTTTPMNGLPILLGACIGLLFMGTGLAKKMAAHTWAPEHGTETWLADRLAWGCARARIAPFPLRVFVVDGGGDVAFHPMDDTPFEPAQAHVVGEVHSALLKRQRGALLPTSWWALEERTGDPMSGMRNTIAIIKDPRINLVTPTEASAHALLALARRFQKDTAA